MSATTKNAYSIILRPIITEKSMAAARSGKYVYRVAMNSNKYEIAWALETIQAEARNPVNVVSVNTMIVKGKEKRGRWMKRSNVGRTKDWKKAVVTLRPGQQIELVEGV
jgi:large subunit ribosomal protein L23